jgi:hypothetical protein
VAVSSLVGSVHPAYNPSFSARFFFSRNNIFLTTNQPTVFFSRLISTAERGQLSLFLFLPSSLFFYLALAHRIVTTS